MRVGEEENLRLLSLRVVPEVMIERRLLKGGEGRRLWIGTIQMKPRR